MKSFTKFLTSAALLVAMLCFNSNISYSQTTRNAGTNAELTNAVTASSDGDIINVTNDIVVSGAIAISKTLTINGNNSTISVPVPGLDDEGIFAVSPSAFRVFTITGAGKTITLNNMTIKGGANVAGAGINTTSATVKLNYVIICDCFGGASNGGGGIYNSGGKLFFNNVQLIRNAARYGGGFVNAGGTMFVENSSFSENRSTGTNGGGGGGENNGGGIIYMNNSTFSNNKSTEIGGGINNYGGTLWISNSSFTGNVGYGSTTSGGAIGLNGGTANIVNCIFAYNYIRTGGTDVNPTAYGLSDITKYGGSGTLNSYYNIYHSAVSSNVSISNITYTGDATGSDNSIFTNGLYTKLTDGTGAVLGTGQVFQPFLISPGNTGAITLKTGSFALQVANLGTQTGFYNNNGTNPIVGYYNGTSWVTLAGANAENYIVNTDQFGTTRANPPVRGSVEAVVNDAYMLKINKAANGTVNGGSLYGDIYSSGTVVTVFAIPNTGYVLSRWDYVTGGSGTASTNNPYEVLVDRNITLVPVFTAAAAGTYSITYIGNGNTAGDPPATVIYSSSTTIAGKGDMQYDGYSFTGWNKNDNGSGLSFAPGATYSSGTNLTLYAQWRPMNIWSAAALNDNWNNAANWSGNLVPTSNIDAFIPTNPAGGDIFPIVNIANANCKNLIIAAGGSLNIPSGNTLTVYEDMDNSGSSQLGNGTFTFSGSSAQIITGINKFANLKINNSNGVSLSGNTEITDILTVLSGSLTTNNNLTLLSDASKTAIISGNGTVNISGNVNVQRFLGVSGGYHYSATPLSGSNFTQIADDISIRGWGAEYKSGGWSNVWKYDETDISQISHPDGVFMNGWRAPASINESMVPGKGYAFYVGANAKINFTGTVNNGSLSIAVTNTSSVSNGGNAGDDGWNFVANSYPCSVDWEASSGWNKTNVDNAIYRYEPTGTVGGSYKSFVNGIGNPSGVTGIIAPMQGFFVHASSNGMLGMNNSVRVDNASVHFNKKSDDKQLVKLSVNNAITPDITDETTVYFDDNATSKFDSEYDAYKMMNNDDNIPNLYTRSADNLKLSINGLNSVITDETTVPLVLNVKHDGDYVIRLSEMSNLPTEISVYLVDTETGISQSLNEKPEFAVSLTAADNDNRFYLKFAKKATGIEKQSDNSVFYTYVSGKTLNIAYSSSSISSATLNIYNILGQQAVNSKQIINGNYQFELPNGTYIVKLVSDNKTYIKKLLVK